jgi:hypothetical protein
MAVRPGFPILPSRNRSESEDLIINQDHFAAADAQQLWVTYWAKNLKPNTLHLGAMWGFLSNDLRRLSSELPSSSSDRVFSHYYL